MMIVTADDRIDKNLSRADASTIRDEHRISLGIGVVHHPRAVGRPRHLNGAVEQKGLWPAAHHWNDLHPANRRAAKPDFRSVARETEISHRSQSRHVAV